MLFPFNVYLLAMIGAALTSALTLPLWRKFCLRIDLIDDPGQRKIHESPVPLAGGLAVITGMVAPIFFGLLALKFRWIDIHSANLLSYGFHRRALELFGIVAGAFGMLLLGLCDDKWELKASTKFYGQLFIALLVAACGVRITIFVQNIFFSYA